MFGRTVKISVLFLGILFSFSVHASGKKSAVIKPVIPPVVFESWKSLKKMMILGYGAEDINSTEKFKKGDFYLWLGNMFPTEVRKNKKLWHRYRAAFWKNLYLNGLTNKKPKAHKNLEQVCSIKCLFNLLMSFDPGGRRFKRKGKKAVLWASERKLIPPSLLGTNPAKTIDKGHAAEVFIRYYKMRRGESAGARILTAARGSKLRFSLLMEAVTGLAGKEVSIPKMPFKGAWITLNSRYVFDESDFRSFLTLLSKSEIRVIFLKIPVEFPLYGGLGFSFHPFTPVLIGTQIEAAESRGIKVILAPRLKKGVGLPTGWTEDGYVAALREIYLFSALLVRHSGAAGLSLGEEWGSVLKKAVCGSGLFDTLKKAGGKALVISFDALAAESLYRTCLYSADFFETVFKKGKEEKSANKVDEFYKHVLKPVLIRGTEKGRAVSVSRSKRWFAGVVWPLCIIGYEGFSGERCPISSLTEILPKRAESAR